MREDFNVEEFLDAELPQNDPSHPISKTQTREWVHLAIHIAIGIIFGVACTFVLVPFFRKSNSRGDYPECWAILQSATLVNKFPLPLEVNRSAHQAAHMSLDFSHERIEPVIDIRSKVVEKLTFMRAAFVRHLPHTIYMFYQPDRKAAIATVRGDILSAHNYLKEAAAQVEVLTDYYNGMRAAYNGLHASARAELYHAQMNDKQAGYVKWWSDLVSFFHGHTAEYKKRLGEASRMVEEADSGLVALNEEVQRLERINRVINEVARILKVMLELIDKGAFEENNRRDCELRPSRIRPKAWLIWILQRLRIWNVPKTKDGYCQPSLLTAFQSHILENRSLKRYWKELDQFIKEGEASLTIDIKPDWCKSIETYSDDR